MKLYKTAVAFHTWNCVLVETNRTTIPLSCCDPAEMRAPLPSDLQSLEPLWVSPSAHSHSAIDGSFSCLREAQTSPPPIPPENHCPNN